MERNWIHIFNNTQSPIERWQSQSNAPQQRIQQQQQTIPQTPYTPQQLQQIWRQQQILATDLRKPIPNNNNKNNYNNMPPLQPQQPALYYNNYNSNRERQMQAQPSSLSAPNLAYPYNSGGDGGGGNTFTYVPVPSLSTLVNNSNVEQFDMINPSQRNARTFGFLSDLFSSFAPSCVDPCTIEAYNQNRCCIVVVNPPSPACCQYPAPRPFPPVSPPLSPLPPQIAPPPMLPPPRPPISCCNTCSYGFYGPPPCRYYWGGNGGGRNLYGGNPGGLIIGGGLNNLGYGVLNTGQLLNYFPRQSFFG
ncbi:uncharacterized protein LOC129238276 [Anastrepha obliqua]|uniref:uncharacterized protein LOC129238276 n=1 Tax=Anastrepha obliqua TaxID=95512 RepID=UPI0024094897|nr:uncharacterized protein LOC129238276 [Anastrepha obliqua]